jgi:methyltransferase (TIGR00027 family)
METGQPSRTSILVAAARAFGAREPDITVRNPDYLAERFVGEAERRMIATHPIVAALDQEYLQARENPEVAGLSNTMLARTRFIDDHLKRAVENGAAQVVILGAGFDTRAYRFQELLHGKTLFEVDFGPTQAIKKQRVAEAVGTVPENLVFVEIDFKRETLREVLERAGYRPDLKTFFIWEGVSMYLTEDAVRSTLRTIAEFSATGSTLTMDFAEQALLDVLTKFPEAPQNRFTREWQEPWTFGVPDGKERDFFRECGLELREILMLAGKEMSRKYLTRADGTKLAVRRVRSPLSSRKERGVLERLARAGSLFFWFMRLMAKRSKWYAIVEVAVPESHASAPPVAAAANVGHPA